MAARPALAATRATWVLDLIASHPTERFTLAEIQRRTGINAASAHALLATLTETGYVQRHAVAKTYSLGPALVAVGAIALRQQPALDAGLAQLDGLARELRLEIVLTCANERDIVVVGRSADSSGFGSVIHQGQRLPLRPPFGTVFLAWAPIETIEAWLERARPELTDEGRAVQLRALETVRARGYAVGLDSGRRVDIVRFASDLSAAAGAETSERLEQLVAELAHTPYHVDEIDDDRSYDVGLVAAPIFDSTEQVGAAITVNGLQPGISGREIRRIGERITSVTTVITKQTHGRRPGD